LIFPSLRGTKQSKNLQKVQLKQRSAKLKFKIKEPIADDFKFLNLKL